MNHYVIFLPLCGRRPFGCRWALPTPTLRGLLSAACLDFTVKAFVLANGGVFLSVFLLLLLQICREFTNQLLLTSQLFESRSTVHIVRCSDRVGDSSSGTATRRCLWISLAKLFQGFLEFLKALGVHFSEASHFLSGSPGFGPGRLGFLHFPKQGSVFVRQCFQRVHQTHQLLSGCCATTRTMIFTDRRRQNLGSRTPPGRF